ncbi:MAG: phospho-sugar mutase [Verrucomicrobia bacterium]|nr:phospho-sugar mutase [Verrucomicrobiota bacterium]
MNAAVIRQKLSQACQAGNLLAPARDNCMAWLDEILFESWIIDGISELVEGAHWAEINDRFYKTLAFGTGGLRGRTIGRVVTRGERGGQAEGECPERPAAGSNCMNDFNVRRATMGLVAYIQQVGPVGAKPHVVFAHDTRHFSRHFAELAARTVVECGGQASLFESERSTPELSFAVRHLGADAGVVVTASHNPPHDNGYKVYFNDGAQVVEPHAGGIIRQVQSLAAEAVCRKPSSAPQGIRIIGREMDDAYLERLHSLALEPEMIRKHGVGLKVVYSPLHGTGARIVPALLMEMGFCVLTVAEQMKADGCFPTVRSPNPENAEALTLGIRLADLEKADLVLATDPDADRMGVAIRGQDGKMELINGNQIGSIMAHYRLERLFARGILNATNRQRVRLIKTVVTTDLQKAIAQKFGVEIPETLTGFKYIGAKLQKYETQLLRATGMDAAGYRRLPESAKRDELLRHSAYYVFGGEESYGYSASDFTRDKDANAACLMFAEAAAFARSRQQTLMDYLDSIYAELGYYREKLGQLVYEGAEGAEKIRRILESYEQSPPSEMAGLKVTAVRDHAQQEIRDCEGDVLPRERLFFVDLENGARYGVRGSGTEPKIKFYLFSCEKPPLGSSFSPGALAEAKRRSTAFLDSLWMAIEGDARKRADA